MSLKAKNHSFEGTSLTDENIVYGWQGSHFLIDSKDFKSPVGQYQLLKNCQPILSNLVCLRFSSSELSPGDDIEVRYRRSRHYVWATLLTGEVPEKE